MPISDHSLMLQTLADYKYALRKHQKEQETRRLQQQQEQQRREEEANRRCAEELAARQEAERSWEKSETVSQVIGSISGTPKASIVNLGRLA